MGMEWHLEHQHLWPCPTWRGWEKEKKRTQTFNKRGHSTVKVELQKTVSRGIQGHFTEDSSRFFPFSTALSLEVINVVRTPSRGKYGCRDTVEVKICLYIICMGARTLWEYWSGLKFTDLTFNTILTKVNFLKAKTQKSNSNSQLLLPKVIFQQFLTFESHFLLFSK